MRTFVWGDVKRQIEQELDLKGEDFVVQDELNAYGNDAIADGETEIHGLGKENEYYLTCAKIRLVKGQSLYDLPSNIYANKVVQLLFNDGNEQYEINYIRGDHRFSRMMNAQQNDRYQYIIQNDSSSKIALFPAAYHDGEFVTIWYIRSANRIVDDSSIIDIPEAESYIKAKVKGKCMAKENLGVMPTAFQEEIDRNTKKLLKTLSGQVVEDSNIVDELLEHYDLHV